MTDALTALRDSYDALAAEHADVVSGGLDDRPLDRALLATFAELVRAGGNVRVADVGCGAGRVTRLLSRLGLDASGIDLSPGMVALARRTYPQLRFEEGSMLALDLPAAALGGLTASAAGILVLAHGPMISGGRGSTFQLIMTNPTGTSPA
jgi:SAM-dependent methyltransferase